MKVGSPEGGRGGLTNLSEVDMLPGHPLSIYRLSVPSCDLSKAPIVYGPDTDIAG